MDVICPQCGTTYELEEAQIQSPSVRVKCSACSYMFRVYRSTPSQIVPALQNWIVRSTDGVISHVPDQATLQRMIVERKVSRDDELSRDGRAWQLLGDVPDFQSFFALIEQATVSSAVLSSASGAFPAAAMSAQSASAIQAVGHGSAPLGPAAVHAAPAAQAAMLIGSMDPGATLEFGLPAASLPHIQTTSPHVDQEAKTEIAVEAVVSPSVQNQPAAPAVQAQAPILDVASVPAVEKQDSLKSTAVAIEKAAESRGSSSQELAIRVSPPSSASFDSPEPEAAKEQLESFDLAPVQDEGADWFTGSAADLNAVSAPGMGNVSMSMEKQASSPAPSDLSFEDERPTGERSFMDEQRAASNGASSMRDFSDFGGLADDGYDPADSMEFMLAPPSSKGKWFGLGGVGLLLVLGILYIAQPSLFARISVVFGMSETTPEVTQKLNKAYTHIAQFHPKSFDKAKALLVEAEHMHGGTFSSLLAFKIELEMARIEFDLFRMFLAKQQKQSWEKKLASIAAEVKAIPEKDPEKEAKLKAIEVRKKTAESKVAAFGAAFGQAFKSYQKHWKSASDQRAIARQKDPTHPLIELAELHLYSLSSDAIDKFPALYSKLLKASTDPIIQTRLLLLSAWVALHTKKYKKSIEGTRKVLASQGKWGYPQLLRARSFASLKQYKEAQQILTSLLTQQKAHPLALEYKTYLKSLTEQATPKVVAAGKGQDTKTTDAEGTQAAATRRPPPRRRYVASFSGLVRSADRLRRRERYRRAQRLYLRAMKKKKTSRVYSGLGWCALELSSPSVAIRYFQTAQRMSSRNADAFFGLGLAYRRGKQNAKAKQALKTFLSRFPRHRDAGEVRMILRSL